MNEFRIGRRQRYFDKPQENLLERRITKQSPPAQPSRQLTKEERERVAEQVAEIKKGFVEIDELIEQLRARTKKYL